MTDLVRTRLWQEALRLPETLAQTLAADGRVDAAQLLGAADVRRIVVTGNGAAYYAASAFWLAALERPHERLEVTAVPAGLLARGRFAWRAGDRLLAVSSSGELRDAIEALAAGAPQPHVAVGSAPASSIAASAGAFVRVEVETQDVPTHTQAYCGNVLALLALWAELRGESADLDGVPEAVGAALDAAPAWAERFERPPAAVAFAAGAALPAALEAALLLKEVALVPAEGMEVREGATSGMYALRPGHLVLSLGPAADELVAEAERTCAGTGATVVRVPPAGGDARLVPLTSFAAALALAATLGLRGGVDVDRPPWLDAYYATTRIES